MNLSTVEIHFMYREMFKIAGKFTIDVKIPTSVKIERHKLKHSVQVLKTW